MAYEQGAGEKGAYKSEKDTDNDPDTKYRRWREEIDKAEKELKSFRDRGQKVVKRYLDDREYGAGENSIDSTAERRFNIFTANVGILQSNLYAKIPKISITRRFNQAMDDVARVAAMMLQATVMQDMEDNDCNFDQVMRDAVEDRLVPGLGQAWLRLETETEVKTLEAVTDEITGEEIQAEVTYEQIVEQEVCIDHVHWADFLYSPCRTWTERRWVGRRVYMGRDELKERFPDYAGDIPLDYTPDKASENTDNTPTNEVFQQAIIYEIWDRVGKRVLWLSKGCHEILDEKPDPLQLEDFDPCPKPLFALTSTSNCVPKADFVIYQDQYNELDEVNTRISLLVAACKVVGVYDTGASGVQKMLQEGIENTLVPVDNWAMFAEKGGIKGQVDWMPLDTIIAALERLRTAREDIKGQIYELTGISDIVRGNTKASETLGAQQLKSQFASTRIQRLQDEVARFAQDILRIKAEIICRHFDKQLIVEMSNVAYSPDSQEAQLVDAALELIKDPTKFNFRVKVQADSLGQQDYQLQKQEKVEFTNAMATFLQSAATTIKALPSSAQMIFETLKFAVSGFKGATELEGMIDQGINAIIQDIAQQKAKAEQQPNPDVMKAQQEMQLKQADAQIKQKQSSQEMQMKQLEFQMDQKRAQLELQHEMQMKEMELQFEQQKNAISMQHDEQKFELQMAVSEQKARQQMVADARQDARDAKKGESGE